MRVHDHVSRRSFHETDIAADELRALGTSCMMFAHGTEMTCGPTEMMYEPGTIGASAKSPDDIAPTGAVQRNFPGTTASQEIYGTSHLQTPPGRRPGQIMFSLPCEK